MINIHGSDFQRLACMKKQDISEFGLSLLPDVITIMHLLTTGIRSKKCVVRRFRLAKVIECTYTNLDSIHVAHYIPRVFGIAYCS